MSLFARTKKFVQNFMQQYGDDRVGTLSAAFAYVTIFSIGPLLLVLVSIVGLIYGQRAVSGRLYADLVGTFGSSTAKTIQDVVLHSHHTSGNVVALIIGIIGVILGSIALTSQLQNSLNDIFSVGPDPKAGIKRTVYAKLKNVLIVLLAGLAITASIVASSLIIAIGSRTQSWLGTSGFVIEAFDSVGFWVVFTLIVYGLYRTLPDIVIPRQIVAATALLVSVMFLIGRLILDLLIGHNRTVSAYGAAASFVSLMLWAYYSGQILFVGAEGIKMYADRNSLNFKPKRFNVRRRTIRVDEDSIPGRFIEAWQRRQKKLK